MFAPRRRLIRPAPVAAPSEQQRQRRPLKLRAQLEQERRALARWQTRLKRAFNAVTKHQQNIARLERQLTKTEGSR